MKVPVFAAPLFILFKRLSYQKASGMLSGITLEFSSVSRIVSDSDCPILIFRGVSSDPEERSGTVLPEQKGNDRMNSVSGETMTLRFELITKASNGWVNMGYDGTDGDQTLKKGHLEWLALVLDSMETRHGGSGIVDSSLDGALMYPFRAITSEPEEGVVSMTSTITVVARTISRCRAQRSMGLDSIA